MPTFLALQCYKCSMMQVKHDKKSSNKWSCSVCNEKQSVRKVFATSTAAKDIRMFVQDYNLSRNIAHDRVLAELVEKEDNEGDIGSMGSDAPSFDIFGDNFIQHHIKTESKWTDYLSPEEKRLCAETLEDASDDGRFVTSIPEKTGRKPRCRAQAAAEGQNEHSPLQQPQALSFMEGRSGEFSNKSIKRFKECGDDVQEENKPPSLWARKTPSGSSLRVQKAASILHGQQLVGHMITQVSVADASVQGSDQSRERAVEHSHVGSKTNEASKIPEVFRIKERPVSKWAAFLDPPEDASGQRACPVSEQEKHVSKWAKYMDFNEKKPRVDSMENSVPSAKQENFPQRQNSSSIWSLKAASNVQCLNGLAKTELDELCETSCFI